MKATRLKILFRDDALTLLKNFEVVLVVDDNWGALVWL